MAEDVFGIVGTTQGGSFRVERVVAEGGFSVVYRAQHGAFRAPVALKCLKIPGEMTSAQREAFLEKFREEAEILFRLSASIPEVVRPLHVDTLALRDGRFVPFLALEWLEGEALDEILYRRREAGQAPMGPAKLVKLLRPVARGLSRAHRFPGPSGTLTIVHRDIKPENILVATVNGQEVVKILDFGISIARRAAARKAGNAAEPTLDTMNAFTPRYGAPEQWDPDRYGDPGPWTDVWALAMTMSESLAGHPVVDGDVEQMRATVFDPKRRPTPRSQGVVLSDAIEAVFQKALTIDPRDRARDIEAFWTPLEEALGLSLTFSRRDVRAETSRHWRDARAGESEPPPSDSIPPTRPTRPLLASTPGRGSYAGAPGRASRPDLRPDPGLEGPRSPRVDALELDIPRGRASWPAPPPSAPSSGRAVLPASAGEEFEAVGAEPVDLERTREALASRHDVEEFEIAPSGPTSVGQEASLAPPRPPSEPPPPSRRRPPPPPAAIDIAAVRTEARPYVPPSQAPEGRHLGQVLRLPIGLIVTGLVVMAIDRGGAVDSLSASPIRPTWVAMALLILGLGLVFWRLLAIDSER
jgi:serine/threonine-protein kinase